MMIRLVDKDDDNNDEDDDEFTYRYIWRMVRMR